VQEEEDPAEKVEREMNFFNDVFGGRPTFTPSGGTILRLDNGMDIFLRGGVEGTPARNGRGIFSHTDEVHLG
jgi:hypothetical protein